MNLTTFEKARVERQCEPLIKKLKSQYLPVISNKEYNYLVDIYTKWYRGYLYFYGKYKSVSTDRITDEFEVAFLRLTMTKKDICNISYMRHTGKWLLIACDLTLNACLEMIEDTPTLHPF
jgi:hypothetical protein